MSIHPSDVEEFKEWQREWAGIRREYLLSFDPVTIVSPVSSSPYDGYQWECLQCGDFGNPESYELAELHGTNHNLSHVPERAEEELEALKLELMPEKFMSPNQKMRKEMIAKSKESKQ